MGELWKDIKGYEGFYQISNNGNVRSVDRIIIYRNGKRYKYKGVNLNKSKDTRGYLQVGFNVSGVKSTHRIHRLVAMNFIDGYKSDKEVNHIDGDKNNNSVKNLEWVTSSENTKKGYDLGLFEKARKAAAESAKGNSYRSKAVEIYVKSNEEYLIFDSARNASRNFGWSVNYFTQLLRVGGENKLYKVKLKGES